MTFKHGTYTDELPTSITPPVEADSGLVVAVGTAPVNLGDVTNVNKIKLCYTYSEAVAAFGMSSDFDKYTLCEVIKSHFALFNVAPLILINVLSPATHKTAVTAEAKTLVNDTTKLTNKGVILSSVVVKVAAATKTLNTDYTLAFNDDGECVVTRLSAGTITAGATLAIDYDHLNPAAVTSSDVVGGVDASGNYSGIELIEQVFPQKRLLPGTLIAPKFSKNPAVYAVMVAKVQAINGLFKAMTVADIDDTSATVYTDAPAWKNTNSYTDPRAIVTYGKVKLGNDAYYLSTQLASLMVLTDVTNDDVPYVSPSNKSLKMDSYTINGAEAFLTPEQANYLNGEGITTALNFIGGWKAWGNRTAAFPANTDVKDNFIPIRRMFNWVSNSLILSHYSKVDNPLNRRQIDAVIDSANIWFNGLAAREQILGGRVEFLESENPTADLMNGITRYHVYVTPPSPNERQDFIVEYDPSYISSLL